MSKSFRELVESALLEQQLDESLKITQHGLVHKAIGKVLSMGKDRDGGMDKFENTRHILNRDRYLTSAKHGSAKKIFNMLTQSNTKENTLKVAQHVLQNKNATDEHISMALHHISSNGDKDALTKAHEIALKHKNSGNHTLHTIIGQGGQKNDNTHTLLRSHKSYSEEHRDHIGAVAKNEYYHHL